MILEGATGVSVLTPLSGVGFFSKRGAKNIALQAKNSPSTTLA